MFFSINTTKERTWLKEVDSISLQFSLKNLADSYSRFFKKQNKALRFKSKKYKIQSYTTKHTNGNIAIVGNKIKLPKLGFVKFTKSRVVVTKTKTLRISTCVNGIA
ncbi:A0A073JZU4 (Transposase Flags:) (Fragment) [Bacillus cytotoxicus]|uniref:A0A073JZU4 (Transposase Flags:) n=1 Tax=Bacillus cytotoxicus TaxID=580165 RepID=A0AAX2CNH3_9BACI